MQKLLSLSGWGLVRIVPLNLIPGAEEICWEPRWIALESGKLLFYTDEAQIYPESMTALTHLCVPNQRELENGEVMLTVQGEDIDGKEVFIEIGLKSEEISFWQQVIDLHVATMHRNGNTIISPIDLTMDDVFGGEDGSAASSIRIDIKGESHTIVVSSNDDVSQLAEQFITKNDLKPELGITIERELFKAQINGSLIRESKLKKQFSHVRRRLLDVAIAEGRAARAELHAANLANTLNSIESLVPQIYAQLDDARRNVLEREIEIEELSRQAREEDSLMHDLAKESDEMAHVMEDQKEEAKHLIIERAALTKKLRRLQARASSPSPPRDIEAVSHSSPSQTVSELRHAKVHLTMQLLDREVEIKKLAFDLQQALGARAAARARGGSVESLEPADTAAWEALDKQQKRSIAGLEEKNRYLSGSLKASEEAAAIMRDSLNKANTKTELLATSLKQCEKKLAERSEDLRELKLNATVRNYDTILAENRSLRDQVLTFRSEVTRLRARLEEDPSSAMEGIKSLQFNDGHTEQQFASPRADLGSKQGSSMSDDRSNPPLRTAPRTPVYLGGEESKSFMDQNSSPEVIYELDLSTTSASAAAALRTPVWGRAEYAAAGGSIHKQRAGSPDRGQNITAEVKRMRDESVQYVWEPSLDVASARISPVVENRLLRDIFRRYVGETTPHMGTTTLMTLTKFGRFAKDFGVSIIAKGAAQPPFLVCGEIDVIFLNATTSTPGNHDLPERSPRPFGVRAGAGTPQQYKKSSLGTAGSAPVLSVGQFVSAVKELACKLYASVVEQETGTVFGCLPPRQKEIAARAVMDVMMKKKIMPTAHTLGLIPWPLIYLDQTVTSILTFSDASGSLSRNFQQIYSWFQHYSQSEANEGSGDGSLNYKALSRLAHDYGFIPFLLKEPQLYRYAHPLINPTYTYLCTQTFGLTN